MCVITALHGIEGKKNSKSKSSVARRVWPTTTEPAYGRGDGFCTLQDSEWGTGKNKKTTNSKN